MPIFLIAIDKKWLKKLLQYIIIFSFSLSITKIAKNKICGMLLEWNVQSQDFLKVFWNTVQSIFELQFARRNQVMKNLLKQSIQSKSHIPIDGIKCVQTSLQENFRVPLLILVTLSTQPDREEQRCWAPILLRFLGQASLSLLYFCFSGLGGRAVKSKMLVPGIWLISCAFGLTH